MPGATGSRSVGAASVSTSIRGVEQYQTAIDAATTEVFADKTRRDALVGCTPTATDTATCARTFVTKFGRQAWRMPLTSAQIDRYVAAATQLNTTLGDPIEAIRLTANAVLESPYFLYRQERGEAATGSAFWRFTAHEMASRLSYFLTNTMPDSTLFAAADKGDLTTVDGIKAQADRLLKTDRGRQSIGNFVDELFQVTIIGSRAKDATFPAYTPALQSAMAREASSMMQALVFDRNADAMEMFTTRQTFANKELADLYGVPSTGMTSTSWKAITLPADGPRAGILSTAGYLSLYASQKEGSPTQRGKFIRTLMMCGRNRRPSARREHRLRRSSRRHRAYPQREARDPPHQDDVQRLPQLDGSTGPAARDLRRHRRLPQHRPRQDARSDG